MTLFFDLTKIEKEASSSSTKFLDMLKAYHEKKHLNGASAPTSKTSFLLNPTPVISRYEKEDVSFYVQYVKLAGRRDYTLYKYHGVTYLDTSFFPDLAYGNIQSNPLIKLVNNKIYFKYEEIYNGIKIRRHQG